MVFAGAAGVYSQDNATLFHDDAGNKNGVGTNLPSATLEVADTSVLSAESLTNPNLTGGASWTVTGDMALAADAATYTHATGVGTLNQASGTLAIAGVANALYSFTYTISNLSAFLQVPVFTITTGFALTAVPLVINQAGVHTVIFRAAAVPGNFVINVTSNQPGALTIDTLSLKRVIGGNLIVNGNSQINGRLGIGTPAPDSPLTISANTAPLPAPAAGTMLHLGAADASGIALTFDGFGSGSAPTFFGRHAFGTAAAPSATLADKVLFQIGGLGYGTTGYAASSRATVSFLSAEVWSDTAQGAYLTISTTPKTTVAQAEVVRILDNGNVGLGNTASPTALTVGGATTALNSPIQWSSGAIPLAVPGVLFTQTANKATTANAATSLFGTGVGTLTLPANLLVVGRKINIKMGGFVSQADTGAGTKTLLLSLGGVTVATGTSGATFATTLNSGWIIEASITCRTAGAGGTVVGGGSFQNEIATATANGVIISGTGTAACNTTGTLLVDLTFNNGSTPNGTITSLWSEVSISN